MTMHTRCVSIIIGLLCLLPESTTSTGLSGTENEDALIERRVFEPQPPSRDFGNVVIDAQHNRVYVGAVDFLYSLDADDITAASGQKIRWAPDSSALETCSNFKGDSQRCQNTIRILHSFNDTHVFACGTMAFSPKCIYVNKKDFTKPSGRAERGKWRSPEDPLSSAISTMSGSSLFTATTPSSTNKNGVICKTVGEGSTPVKTNDNDDFWLSDPHFVSAFTVREEDNQEKVIVLLKENAEEIPLEILTQDNDYSLNIVYSRLVSICANDLGGNPWILRNKFATFAKMRIACPAEITRGKSRSLPFFYDEIQSSFLLPNPEDPSNPTIYAIFTTPRGAFEATATCVYEMNDIRKYLATTKHWNRPGKRDLDLFSVYEGQADDAPESCAQDTRVLSADRLTFTNEHPIKYGIIKPKGGYAVYQDAGRTYSHVLVDRIKRREKLGGELVDNEYDVVHYVTDSGFIRRIVFLTSNRSFHWEIPSRTLYKGRELHHKILTAKISNGYAYFGTTSSLIQLQIASCSSYPNCAECSLANDPYCEWDALDNACKKIDFDRPFKRRPAFYRNLNETNCNAREMHIEKKSGEVDIDDLKQSEVGNLKQRHQMNDEFTEKAREQNRTIASLRSQNDFLTTNLAESMSELSRMMNNYTKLSALLLQYDARRKLVLQLYRNTVFSLHSCQREAERSQRQAADKKRNLDAIGQDSANVTNPKCTPAKIETERCSCESELQPEPRPRGRAMAKLKASFSRSLESCQATNSELNQELSLLEDAKENITKERDELQKTIAAMTNENERLTAAVVNAEQNAQCDDSKWHLYRPSKKLFLVTRDTASYYKAVSVCAGQGGKIAEPRQNGEIRFVYNLTQKIAPRKRYWIGMQKKRNGTMFWSNGAVFDRTTTRRFSKSQTGRIRNREIYCVETTSREGNWQLLPCHKPRKVMCMKEFKGEIR